MSPLSLARAGADRMQSHPLAAAAHYAGSRHALASAWNKPYSRTMPAATPS